MSDAKAYLFTDDDAEITAELWMSVRDFAPTDQLLRVQDSLANPVPTAQELVFKLIRQCAREFRGPGDWIVARNLFTWDLFKEVVDQMGLDRSPGAAVGAALSAAKEATK